MRILIVNSFCGILSTGRICAKIAEREIAQGNDVRIAYGRGFCPAPLKKIAIRIGTKFDLLLHVVFTRLFDWHGVGFCSYIPTRKFLFWVDSWCPDVIWIHNVHGYYIHWPSLFRWIKAHPEVKVKWTLHDCWAFTGHCTYFTFSGCQKWRTNCLGCPSIRDYPKAWFRDRAAQTWKIKRELFSGIRHMTIITPSKWLAELARESFLCEYPVEVINNTIDREVFCPTPSDILSRLGIKGKKVILGIASTWDVRKGLADFCRLNSLIDKNTYCIVLVGLSRKQVKNLPNDMVGLERTNSMKELAELYSAADWFFNPTREENYPTVNIEAVACGCRVATYDTGGCAETVEGAPSAVVLRGRDRSPEGFVAKALGEGTDINQQNDVAS